MKSHKLAKCQLLLTIDPYFLNSIEIRTQAPQVTLVHGQGQFGEGRSWVVFVHYLKRQLGRFTVTVQEQTILALQLCAI